MEKQQTPSFLKLYTGDSDGKLIPDSFMDQYGKYLSGKKIALTSTYGDPVVVSVEMIGGRSKRKCFYFTLGWTDFVEENRVEEGDFMIFNFIGDKTANVVLYDPSGCVKGLKVKKQQVGSFAPKKRVRNDDDEETEHASVPRKGKRVKREAPKLNKVKPELDSSAKAYGLAKSASFSVDYKKYNRGFLNIRKKFSETIELSAGDKVQLQDPNGDVWSVSVVTGDARCGPYHLRLSSGWSGFVKANRLEVGDRLEFCCKPELGLIQVKIDKK
ncbi:B3 domain-containing protein REM5 [Linum grandiflorum]